MISCLFITFNRSHLLKTAVESLRGGFAKSNLPYEIVISDDGSAPEHVTAIRALNADILALSDGNRGLGNNCNKGITACRMPFILQIQDDWRFTGDASELRSAIEILKEDAQIGIIQFTAINSDLATVKRRSAAGVRYRVYANDYLPWYRGGRRPYSDRPHLKSRSFVDHIGPYVEDAPMTAVELEFQNRIANQGRWRVAQIVGRPLFEQLDGGESHNPGALTSPGVRKLTSTRAGRHSVNALRKARDVADRAAARSVYGLRSCFDALAGRVRR